MGQAKLDNLEDYTHFRRIQLSGDLPTYGGMTVPSDSSSDTGDLGFLLAMGYHYSDSVSGAPGASTDQFVKTALGNTQFIHGAFESSATSGTSRGAYLIHRITGAGSGVGGECIRARTHVWSALTGATSVHGMHSELAFYTAGGTSGDGAAVRGTLSVNSDATAPTGHLSSLRLDSNFGQAAYANAVTAWISAWDVNSSYPMPFFLDLYGTATVAVSGAHQALVTGTCSTLGHGLRVSMPDGSVGYIPICTTCS